MSILSGYPVGSRIVADLYSNGSLGRAEAERLSYLCSTSGPMFILGSVGSAMFGDGKAGAILFASHLFGVLSVFFPHKTFREERPPANRRAAPPSAAKTDRLARRNGAKSCHIRAVRGRFYRARRRAFVRIGRSASFGTAVLAPAVPAAPVRSGELRQRDRLRTDRSDARVRIAGRSRRHRAAVCSLYDHIRRGQHPRPAARISAACRRTHRALYRRQSTAGMRRRAVLPAAVQSHRRIFLNYATHSTVQILNNSQSV